MVKEKGFFQNGWGELSVLLFCLKTATLKQGIYLPLKKKFNISLPHFIVYFKKLADAPGQAHLQGTQRQHTKANLAKEPALFLRFRDTPCFVGHILSTQVTMTKGEHTTGGLLLCWHTNKSSASYRYQPISS